MNAAVESYVRAEWERYVEELAALLRIPSVSVGTEHRDSIQKAADWLADRLRKAGMEHVEVIETEGNPIVYADWLHAPGKPTVLVYGHYDVQPAEAADGWDTDPFEPVVRDGNIYARGATDDKGQLIIHVNAVEALLQAEGALPVNVKFCIEGEEEISSPSLPGFLEQHADRLHADVIVISDGPMIAHGTPSICTSLRGLAGMEVRVKGPAQDLHSGLYGGGVQNPIHALTHLLASLHAKDGKVAVEGFYNGVQDLTAEEREQLRCLPSDEEQIQRELKVPALYGEEGYTFLERTTARPTLEVVSVTGGFQGSGLKPAIPTGATTKIACRLVGQQDPDAVMDAIERHLQQHCPPGVTVELIRQHGGRPYQVSADHPYLRAAAEAYGAAFGKEPVYTRSGGSIPIVEVFNRVLGVPVVMMEFGLPDENLHGPNEHFHLENLEKGMLTACRYLHRLAEEK
ncbi:dipeptidase [Xylanibacillus composti]|uniref:Peptidase M20 n=1 Tax=Xylanibacillus composti TaxID=1572762 RepID=A0A8J4H3P6_9BACL|nr:dipeptidase [Xylanibacillus composti]MDT9726243.1 dipeptidase [Xylanibacillus composti]GIQ68093.1 peptidase M20 [Xylanibacillus composti]